MPWNGSGTATRIYNWVNDKNASIDITASRMDGDSNDFVSMINNTLCKDGQNVPTATLPMATYRHTGVGNAAARTDYAAAGQVQDDTFTWGATSAGSANAQTIGPTPAIAAYAAGQRFRFIAGYSNSGAATLAVSGLTAKNIYKITGSGPAALVGSEIIVGNIITVQYDGTQFQLIGGNALTLGTVTSVGSGTGLTGGPITGSGTLSLATIADKNLLANTSGGTAAPVATTLTALIDEAIDNTQGDILYRSSSAWTQLGPGTSGQFLQTQGASANPQWATLSNPGANPNALRNAGLTDWFSGTSGTVPTTAGVTSWTAEGVFAVATGATLPWAQQASDLTSPLSFYSVKFTGATSNTDLKVRFVVESYTAIRLAGQTVTFQIPVYNNTGGALVATLATAYPSAQDNWGTTTTDLSATNLQSIANGSSGTLSYTLSVSANAKNGYEFIVDFGALSSNTKTIEIGGGFDVRPTPGIATGLNSSPPAPFIADPASTSTWDRRFYQTTYDNGVAPGTSTHVGIVQIGAFSDTGTTNYSPIAFPVRMRADPTVSLWDGAGNSNKFSYFVNGSWTDNVANTAAAANAGQGSFAVSYGNGFSSPGAQIPSVQYAADARIAGG